MNEGQTLLLFFFFLQLDYGSWLLLNQIHHHLAVNSAISSFTISEVLMH